MNPYKQIAKESRLRVLDMIYRAKTSHIGSNFSCADLMAVLFEKIDLDKDKFILSAGWKAAMLYFHLWRKGRITEGQLDSYCQPKSEFIGLAEPIIPEIPFAGGSMQIGLPAAAGFALAKKMKKEKGHIYCLVSDGELQGGMIWEAAMIASHHKLRNLTVFIDNNRFQAMGKTKDILNLEPLGKKWEAFGWDVFHINGHNYAQIEVVLEFKSPKPKVVIADTVKGRGVSFMENNNLYHYKQIDPEEYKEAQKCLS